MKVLNASVLTSGNTSILTLEDAAPLNFPANDFDRSLVEAALRRQSTLIGIPPYALQLSIDRDSGNAISHGAVLVR